MFLERSIGPGMEGRRLCQQALVSSPWSVHATFSSLCARCNLRQPASVSKASKI